MKKDSTIHFFTFSDPAGGSSRQRAFQVAEKLRERGLKTIIHHPPVLAISRTRWPRKALLIAQVIRSLTSIGADDIVFLQRTVANKYFFLIMVAYLFFFRRKMVFDIDDPIYLHSFFKTKVFVRMADAVIACTHQQAQWVRRYNPRVYIIHISLDFSTYRKFEKNHSTASSPLVLGWVGAAPEHIYNLALLVPIFKRLMHEYANPFVFVLIGALGEKKVYDLFAIPGLRVTYIDALAWSDPEAVPREIQKFDIGLQPHVIEGEWNKAKTSFKIIEYMACGLPTVSSPFGEMPHIVEDGSNGFLAKTEDEWVEKLLLLMADPGLRARFGSAGQESVRTRFSYEANIPRLIDIFADLDTPQID